MPDQKCPLCGKNAKFQFMHYGADPKRFTCPICLLFVLPHATEKLIVALPKEKRMELSKKSRNAELGTVFYIFHEKIEGGQKIKFRYDLEKNWI